MANVCEFGAQGDGHTDDTDAIQAALDAAGSSLGRTAFVPGGVYMINAVKPIKGEVGRDSWIGGGLRPPAGTTLRLAHDAVLKVIPNGSPGYACVYIGHEQRHVTIEGGRIEGDRATHDYDTDTSYPSHESGYGIALHGAQDATIRGVEITGCTGDGVHIGSYGMLIADLPYHPARRVTVTGCTIDGARRNNISVTGCDGVLIENCQITSAGTHDGIRDGTAPRFGIDIENYGEGSVDYQTALNVTIRGCRFIGNQAGAVMNFNGYGAVIEGNYSDNVISFGYSTECIIRGNVITSKGSAGNGIASNGGGRYGANALVTGNVVTGFATGIQVQRDGVHVVGNKVSGFAGTGVTVFGANDATVADNDLADSAGVSSIGVNVANSTHVNVTGNTARTVRTGVNVGASKRVVVSGNTITKAVAGIAVTGASEAILRDNATDLVGHPAGQSYDYRWTGDASVLCQGNVMHGSTTYAIAAANASPQRSRIIGNRIIDATGHSQLSLTGGRHDVVGNTFLVDRSDVNVRPILTAGGAVVAQVDNTVVAASGAVVPFMDPHPTP